MKLIGNTITLGTDGVRAAGGSGGSSTYAGGAGGNGAIAIHYSSSLSYDSSTPTAETFTLNYNTYSIYVSKEINTPGATSFGNLSWTEDLDTSGEVQFQTRSGSTQDSTDGTWNDWVPSTLSTHYISLSDANTHTEWDPTNVTVEDGDTTRNVDYFEDEDEEAIGNLTKLTATAADGYAEDSITLVDLSSYDYITAWVKSDNPGNVIDLGIGETAGDEQEETVSIDEVNVWQKVYWDISDITGTARDEIQKVRFTITVNGAVVYIDNIKAEQDLLTTTSGSAITSTADDYIQYRAILTTTDTTKKPSISAIQLAYTNPNDTYTIDANRVRISQNVDYHTSDRLDITEITLDDIRNFNNEAALTSVKPVGKYDPGTGADGAITISGSVDYNTQNSIAGRSCVGAGDAPNYSVSALGSNYADLTTSPSSPTCLAVGDEVLLINLEGNWTSSNPNLGNYETLRVESIVASRVTFTTSKTKHYGTTADQDDGIGTTNGTQRVMLQRVPNFTNVTINAGAYYRPTAFNGAKGGVMFFRATGTVSVAGTGYISAYGKGWRGGDMYSAGFGGNGGENFCAGKDYPNSGGSMGGYYVGGNGYTNGKCGGGGGGGARGASEYTAGTGSAGAGSDGGAGGGGGGAYSSHASYQGWGGGGGGGGGLGGVGSGGASLNSGSAGNASGTSGAGGNGATSGYYGGDTHARGGGGGGGGKLTLNSVSSDLPKLYFGAGGGGGGYGETAEAWKAGGTGGAGGGVIYIAAHTVSVSGTNGITTAGENGGVGTSNYGGGGGGGGGGSVKLFGNNITLGTNGVRAAGGSGGSSTYAGGAGGNGAIAVFYADTLSYSSSTPTIASASVASPNYSIFISDEVPTPNATEYNKIHWNANLDSYGMIQVQTRSGKSNNSTDGSWEDWKPDVASTNYVSLETADTHINWIGSELQVSEGDVTRDINFFEDEDEPTSTNVTKLEPGFEVDTDGTLNTSLISYWKLDETSGSRSDSYGSNTLADNDTVTSDTGIKSLAGQFTAATSEYLSIDDNASLSTGDIDFSISTWVYIDSKPASNLNITTRYTDATNREYILQWENTGDVFRFLLYNSAGANIGTATASAFGAPSLSTWYHITAWHDSTANTVNIKVNNGTTDSSATTDVPSDTAADFMIGALLTGSQTWDGRIDETSFWKKVLSAQEITDLYNSGSANTYDNANSYAEATISPTDLSSYDYISAWVRSNQTGNVIKLGFDESAATENEETIYIEASNTWQKVYWDITDVDESDRDAVTKLRVTILGNNLTAYIDNVSAERILNTSSGSTISSTPDRYMQYRVIMTTTDSSFYPVLHNIQAEWNNGYKIEQTDSDTVRLYNYTGDTQYLRLDVVVFGADLAEWYTVDDSSLESGDLVSATGEIDEYDVPILTKAVKSSSSSEGNENSLIGAISTKAGKELGIEAENRRLLALAGRIPVKVASSSSSISAGDFLGASEEAGKAEKLETGGITIGRALESWTPDSGKETVKIIVGTTLYSPNSFLTSSGNVQIIRKTAAGPEASGPEGDRESDEFILAQEEDDSSSNNSDPIYALLSESGDEFDGVSGVFSEAAIANLKAGRVEADEVIVNGVSLAEYVANALSGETDHAASEADLKYSDLEARITLLEGANLLGTTDQVDSESANYSTFTVLGKSTLGDTIVNGILDVGILTLNNLDGSINALGPLKLQPLSLDSIFLQGELIEIDTGGNLIIKTGIIEGNENIRGVVVLNPGEKVKLVEKAWDKSPETVVITPSFITTFSVYDISENGFTIEVGKVPDQPENLHWFAIW